MQLYIAETARRVDVATVRHRFHVVVLDDPFGRPSKVIAPLGNVGTVEEYNGVRRWCDRQLQLPRCYELRSRPLHVVRFPTRGVLSKARSTDSHKAGNNAYEQ